MENKSKLENVGVKIMVHYFLKMCFSQVLEKEKRSKRKAKDSEGEESQDEEAADEEGNENSPPRKKQ